MGGGKQMERERLAQVDRGLAPFEIKTFEGVPRRKLEYIIFTRGLDYYMMLAICFLGDKGLGYDLEETYLS